MKKHPLDVAVCAVVMLAAALLFLLPAINRDSSSDLYAEISVDGAIYTSLPLDQNTELTLENGVSVSVKNGSICISGADCPDGLCVKTGALSRPGQSAVCLPNRTVVTVKGLTEPEVDGVV